MDPRFPFRVTRKSFASLNPHAASCMEEKVAHKVSRRPRTRKLARLRTARHLACARRRHWMEGRQQSTLCGGWGGRLVGSPAAAPRTAASGAVLATADEPVADNLSQSMTCQPRLSTATQVLRPTQPWGERCAKCIQTPSAFIGANAPNGADVRQEDFRLR